jgi:hypothetical protein
MSVSFHRRIGYVGNSVHLPSKAEGAKGSAALETPSTTSASARLTASSEESPRGPSCQEAGGADVLVEGSSAQFPSSRDPASLSSHWYPSPERLVRVSGVECEESRLPSSAC